MTSLDNCQEECQSCVDECEDCQLDVSFGMIIQKSDKDENSSKKQASTQTMNNLQPNHYSRKALKLNMKKQKERKDKPKY